jgi:hypothetical protein
MNQTEKRMLDTLKRGRDHFGVVAVKAEFEAEGTRPEEFQRLLELALRADLKVALKIGGCEAVSDLLATHVYGVDYVIAPMVETPYALRKFIEAKDKTHGRAEQRTQFLFNLETETTLRNLDEMIPVAKGAVAGIVFGRVDFTLSRGLPRGAINERAITEAVLTAASACSGAGLEFVLGGSVAVEAIPVLRQVRAVRLDRFETRKIIFDGAMATNRNLEDGIANAVAFELDWLRNKRDYYQSIAQEDASRIKMLEARVAPPANFELSSAAA